MTSILVVGGHDRTAHTMRLFASMHGHRLEHHDGHSSPRKNRALEGMVARADLVIVVTGINSHGAVLGARDMARAKGVPCLICRRFGVAHLARLLEALATRSSVGLDVRSAFAEGPSGSTSAGDLLLGELA